MTVYDPPTSDAPTISVKEVLDDPGLDLDVSVVAGHGGLDRLIDHPRIQKSGLCLVGHTHGLVPSRIQVLGETELSFCETLDEEGRRRAVRHMYEQKLACVLVTRGVDPPQAFRDEAKRTDTPLVVCIQRSSLAITALHTLLDERLAPRRRVHGVLVDVFEVGVLLVGSSGIGKSECALELVMRGHRLVADDVIECDYRPPGMVFGEPAGVLRHHIEVRGLGIINIKDLYGVTAIRERKRVDLVVELEFWNEERSYDRLGIDDRYYEILGVPIREHVVPVRPGRNMSSIIEIAARQELLRQAGHHPSREFIDRLEAGMARPRSELPVPQLPSDRPGAGSPPTHKPVRMPPHRAPIPVTANESAVPPPVDRKRGS